MIIATDFENEYIVTLYYLNADGEQAEEEYRGDDESEAMAVFHNFARDLNLRSAHHGVELRLELTHNGDLKKDFATYLSD